MDLALVIAAFGIGIIVGLTGMGGGALMSPVLVLFFNVPPLTAVSSDLLASAVMKPVGSVVHLRRRTVDLRIVGWLCIGSVPTAFAGVFVMRALGDGEALQHAIKTALGVALLITVVGLVVRAYLSLRERALVRDHPELAKPALTGRVPLRPLPTVVLGAIGGLIVGMTSVGSGSIIIIGLMALYPALKAKQLVGTDLVQAVPLVAAAALGHALYGDLDMAVTLPLLIGSVPGAWLGARLSTTLPGSVVRRALAVVLLASALKMLGAGNVLTLSAVVGALVLGPLVWMLVRRAHGFPARPRRVRGTTATGDGSDGRSDGGTGAGPAGGPDDESTAGESTGVSAAAPPQGGEDEPAVQGQTTA
ncbi:hypothetical protein CLV28_2360 [Sediminihabitans luteus]|uniref:Probable membrane transporter protein n=1 Tax=Sediminihabitans luteus TaxID=1138585 RepID=A0A2M9CD77_9CELL|nr:sulfite exporter TauE/SafE family protein [Sediminihabitans luteus]PJJ69884.1 hypothetical protein CLV28_2360 [Sediminihabitans luteus]GII99203.1 hypothetical protein Slu03_15810 [Sediminihabitans luteus]